MGLDIYSNNDCGLLLSKKGNWSEWTLTATITGDYYYQRKETGRSGHLPQQLLGTTIIKERKLVGVYTYRNNYWGLLLSKKGNWSEWTLTATITGDYYYQRKETGRSGHLPQQLLGTTIIKERKLVGVDTYRNNYWGLLLSKKGNWSEWTLTATITGDYYYQRKETGRSGYLLQQLLGTTIIKERSIIGMTQVKSHVSRAYPLAGHQPKTVFGEMDASYQDFSTLMYY